MLSAVLACSANAAEKQTPEQIAQKDYSTWLPAEGEWSIGFGLNPITTFLGNLFNGNTMNTLGDLAGNPMGTTGIAMPTPFVSVMGGYMLTDSWEIRANVGFGIVYKSNNFYSQDDAALYVDPTSEDKVTDKLKNERYSGSIAIGANYHLGKKHIVQGIFGGGLLYAFGQNSDKYSYGNKITDLNQTPTINSSVGTYTTGLTSYMPNARTLQSTTSAIHRIGAYGTIGMEIFVAPKIALGANVNLYLFYDFTPAVVKKYEGWNIVKNELSTYQQKVTPAQHAITFSTNNIGANLYMNFYL